MTGRERRTAGSTGARRGPITITSSRDDAPWYHLGHHPDHYRVRIPNAADWDKKRIREAVVIFAGKLRNFYHAYTGDSDTDLLIDVEARGPNLKRLKEAASHFGVSGIRVEKIHAKRVGSSTKS